MKLVLLTQSSVHELKDHAQSLLITSRDMWNHFTGLVNEKIAYIWDSSVARSCGM